jgi:hypothetical protein
MIEMKQEIMLKKKKEKEITVGDRSLCFVFDRK